MTKVSLRSTKFYHILTMVFTFCLFVSNMAEMKIINIMGMAQVSAGIMFFPLLYLLNDIMTEVYGFSASRRTIWIALLLNLLFTILMYLITSLPEGLDWEEKDAFESIFALSPQIMLSSLISYFFGELINASMIAYLKIQFQGRLFALRAIFSTLVSSFLESIFFGIIILYSQMTFYGITPDDELLKMVMMLTILKVLYEIILMPLAIPLLLYLKKSEKLDVYEAPSWKKVLSF